MHKIREKKGYCTKGICLLLVFLLAFFTAGCGREEETISLEEASSDAGQERQEMEEFEGGEGAGEDMPDTSGGNTRKQIYVYVCGLVASPGVYAFPAESRVYEALEAAGGILDGAADYVLNQAEKMADGQKIYVPSEEEVQAGEAAPGQSGSAQTESTGTGGSSGDDGRVNINSATEEELMTLSGIGEKKAQAIISYRETHGGFQSPEELMEVEGIKTGTYEKIKDRIKI